VTAAGVNFHEDGCFFAEGIDQINAAPMEAKLAHAGRDTDGARSINHFGSGHERESGSAAALLSHLFHP
jgi:hypothetical protein